MTAKASGPWPHEPVISCRLATVADDRGECLLCCLSVGAMLYPITRKSVITLHAVDGKSLIPQSARPPVAVNHCIIALNGVNAITCSCVVSPGGDITIYAGLSDEFTPSGVLRLPAFGMTWLA